MKPSLTIFSRIIDVSIFNVIKDSKWRSNFALLLVTCTPLCPSCRSLFQFVLVFLHSMNKPGAQTSPEKKIGTADRNNLR